MLKPIQRKKIYINTKILKRIFDIIVSLIALIILAPIFLICALLIKINLGSPIFFKQTRIGKNNKKFKIIKFRTMKNEVDCNGNILSDEIRLTKLGKILRDFSLDELPEMLNILRGDMSLIGPRPLLEEYLLLYNKEQIRRHEVLPGLTGLAQINGRNNISWEEKFNLDIWYVDNWNFTLDIKIFFLTFYKILKREGINQQGQATMEKFKGSKGSEEFN